jgi:hypothetical protein
MPIWCHPNPQTHYVISYFSLHFILFTFLWCSISVRSCHRSCGVYQWQDFLTEGEAFILRFFTCCSPFQTLMTIFFHLCNLLFIKTDYRKYTGVYFFLILQKNDRMWVLCSEVWCCYIYIYILLYLETLSCGLLSAGFSYSVVLFAVLMMSVNARPVFQFWRELNKLDRYLWDYIDDQILWIP